MYSRSTAHCTGTTRGRSVDEQSNERDYIVSATSTGVNHPEPALVFHPLENQLEPSRASAGFPPSRKPTWTIPSQRWFSTLLETNLNSSGKKEPTGPVGFSIPYTGSVSHRDVGQGLKIAPCPTAN